MSSSSRSCAAGGKNPISSPSASHAVGWVGVKTRVPQRRWPILTKIDTDHPAVRSRCGAQLGEGIGLELHHLGLIDRIHRRSRGPGQPVGAGIQPRRNDHYLADTRRCSIGQETVKNLVREANTLIIPKTSSSAPASVLSSPPAANREKKSIPTARTSGSANGSLITGSAALVAAARYAATIVAVAPTLDAKSQLSLSVRAMVTPSTTPNP